MGKEDVNKNQTHTKTISYFWTIISSCHNKKTEILFWLRYRDIIIRGGTKREDGN